MLKAEFSKTWKDFKLSIKLELDKGVGVLFGYSGSGKTQTLRAITGLMTPDEGTIVCRDQVFFDSKKNVNLAPQMRRGAMVFQEHNLFPHMSVRQNILFGAPRHVSKEENESTLQEILKRYRLANVIDKYPAEISGGQKQRCAFARAMISKPDFLCLDEPFNALDNPLRTAMRDCIGHIIHELDIPVLLVTHDIFEAISLADKLFIYMHGEIVQQGNVEEILRNPSNEAVSALVNVTHFIDKLNSIKNSCKIS